MPNKKHNFEHKPNFLHTIYANMIKPKSQTIYKILLLSDNLLYTINNNTEKKQSTFSRFGKILYYIVVRQLIKSVCR